LAGFVLLAKLDCQWQMIVADKDGFGEVVNRLLTVVFNAQLGP
jgi:hypothetical protein